MAESQKGTSSCADPKEKKSLFDDEMGKEFLSSWKDSSMMKDDTIDFSFDTVSSGKRKAFDFGKLDMDFNLDSDSDKLSSFKVDVPDLVFTCPFNKAAKPNEKSAGESSSGNCQGKQDSFTFSFDFNELDNFKFDLNLMKEEQPSMKKLDSEGFASGRDENQGSELKLAGGADVFDDVETVKLPASERMMTSTVETVVDGVGSGNSLNDDLSPKSGTSVDMVVSSVARTLLEKTITVSAEETNQQSNLKAIPTEQYAQQIKQILPVQSPGGIDSIQKTVSDVQTEVGYPGNKVNIESRVEHSVNDKVIAGVGSNNENSEPTNASPMDIIVSECNRDKKGKTYGENPIENVMEKEPMLDDLDLEATSAASLSQTNPHECKANKDVPSSTSKLFVPLSEPLIDKVAPVREKESGVVCSKFSQRSEETEPQLHQPLSTGVEASSFGIGSKGIAAMQSSQPDNGKRGGFTAVNAQIGRKLVGNSKSPSRELTKAQSAVFESEKNVKNLRNIREDFSGDGVPKARQLVVIPRPSDKEVRKTDPVVVGSETNTNNLNNFGSEGSPAISADKEAKTNTQMSVNSALVVLNMGSNKNSKIISLEGLEAEKRKPPISSVNISRSMGASKDQSKATHQRELNSSKNLEKNTEVQGNTASMLVHTVANVEKKMPVITSLKRKSHEVSNANPVPLNPPKRLSQAPSENRTLKVQPRSIVEQQVSDHDIHAECKTKNVFYDQPTSGPEISLVATMKELEIPLAMENDGNIEKAEAYAKELEDVCSMLKKKHEEAKELLVRAIVNNNSLLVLNHPIFNEKIRAVEKVAALLMST